MSILLGLIAKALLGSHHLPQLWQTLGSHGLHLLHVLQQLRGDVLLLLLVGGDLGGILRCESGVLLRLGFRQGLPIMVQKCGWHHVTFWPHLLAQILQETLKCIRHAGTTDISDTEMSDSSLRKFPPNTYPLGCLQPERYILHVFSLCPAILQLV